ncbi:metallophosphoesterase family protein [Methylobacterium nonmethylotrophicum]|uniref:Serine/threonine protein phosphatase n=1 Tax=Methylobacterium nonmethylotrophicum TaxID=1141884 RepID=A0A4Z0NQ72_9HYPH|nr:metallophosphoesterase family protein [Methylobacterium nonmethylotrophicum]TGD99083.1 serine/threonine protein phosphatase [Methylobacterium nonmethylotrophicum]
MLTYAIGDVHGRADLLGLLLARIEAHRAGRPRRIVCLGDVIDRGPDSAGAVALLRELQAREPGAVTCLMGNHEALLLDAVAGARPDLWRINGGAATLASYGVAQAGDLPDDIVAWIAALPTLHGDAQRWYVHGGLDPALGAEASDRETRLWMREPFLSAGHDFGRHVVHGHTPTRTGRPELKAYRTNLDTGAVFGGPLTAGVFTEEQGPPVEILAVR